ncbi:hypothetical protein K402DRAFT_18086 [Aulographum hederae CBS 113979]|uniref:Uncharacterized protein n=1 Tax=Aulographum hederae CBS 113979 TaxID=1176131 RepID=A0A6G1H6J9_9PEZI|nr:hypothetical protein K402DRAFT_18086 [Aulographum hederae CBS 113979]
MTEIMAAASDWPHSPSMMKHSPTDIPSPLYAERPIRPLPKRRLRSRLSDQEADSIVFPTAPPEPTTLFSVPYAPPERGPVMPGRLAGREEHPDNGHAPPAMMHFTKNDGSSGAASSRPGRANPPAPGSTTSSVDGYESFENTNNKKKRKIPLSNSVNGHHSSLSSEMANMGISGHEGDAGAADGDGSGLGQYYGSGTPTSAAATGPGTGISGAGRGRYGRSGRGSLERRPLATTTNGMNSYASPSKARRDWSSLAGAKGSPPSRKRRFSLGRSHSHPAATGQPDQGIISAAIANAAQQGPLTQQKGNENVSLLQQQASKTTPQRTQFTFTCESETSNNIPWHGAHRYPGGAGPGQGMPPVGMGKGVENLPPNMHPNGVPMRGGGAVQASQILQQAAQQPQKKTRPRRPGRAYAIAARSRRLQQEYNNYHHPPARDEIWICEFCEYEDIFGKPPEALIRQYEIKDRKEQKRLAEKRRLLEKAKMKNRKGKKGSKKNNNSNNGGGGGGGGNQQASQQAQQQQKGGQHAQDATAGAARYDDLPPEELEGDAEAGEEYFDDEFDAQMQRRQRERDLELELEDEGLDGRKAFFEGSGGDYDYGDGDPGVGVGKGKGAGGGVGGGRGGKGVGGVA